MTAGKAHPDPELGTTLQRDDRAGHDSRFADALIAWHAVHGRHDLPWQGTRDAYRIWVSEIMLQQTQVSAVIAYFTRFMDRFPTVAALADAPLDDVLGLWSGLGYYARARNLHLAARTVVSLHQGRFPLRREVLQALPGIGRSTAAAIAAFASGEREAILDGNVKRVLTRHFAIPGFPGTKTVEAKLWAVAESLLPDRALAAYTQAQMDLGATVCTRARPRCDVCPLKESCLALRSGQVTAFPEPRPRRTRPLRQQTLWLLRDKAHCLLERRPPAGIWGGLWSLPEHRPAYVEDILMPGESLQLRHEFTHFSLDITVEMRSVQPSVASLLAADGGPALRWVPLDEAMQLGLPAPIRRVLEGQRDTDLFTDPAVHSDTTGAAQGAPADPPAPALAVSAPRVAAILPPDES